MLRHHCKAHVSSLCTRSNKPFEKCRCLPEARGKSNKTGLESQWWRTSQYYVQ